MKEGSERAKAAREKRDKLREAALKRSSSDPWKTRKQKKIETKHVRRTDREELRRMRKGGQATAEASAVASAEALSERGGELRQELERLKNEMVDLEKEKDKFYQTTKIKDEHVYNARVKYFKDELSRIEIEIRRVGDKLNEKINSDHNENHKSMIAIKKMLQVQLRNMKNEMRSLNMLIDEGNTDASAAAIKVAENMAKIEQKLKIIESKLKDPNAEVRKLQEELASLDLMEKMLKEERRDTKEIKTRKENIREQLQKLRNNLVEKIRKVVII